jgi:hypothetical protein
MVFCKVIIRLVLTHVKNARLGKLVLGAEGGELLGLCCDS